MSTLVTHAQALARLLPPRLQAMLHWRFIKFGLVGGSGTVINIAVLYLAQEHLLRGIADFHDRLNYSIALAISVATLSNFYWNRRLTWGDRAQHIPQSAVRLFVKYVMAAALSIAIQTLLTKWLALYLHYLEANVLAIVVASVANFLANDRLTFRRHRVHASAPAPASPVPSHLPTPMTSPAPESSHFRAPVLWIGLAIAVALGYLFGLGGDHIPRNGDELVYANIARLTAESGHWLPLRSAWDFMRNTKPPLLFWQAMVAGSWGEHWTLFNLRLPSLAYTWGIALMVGLLTWRLVRGGAIPDTPDAAGPSAASRESHARVMGAIAAIVYLSFFTTYRYGRPYLTSGPETFWLFGVFFALAWEPKRLLASRWKFPLLAGLSLGLGCLYKSFVMVVPVGFALALCYQVVGARRAPWQLARPGIVADGIKVAAMCLIGLGLFGLWFALDPQPGEVWREFVVGENAGKMNSSRGYFKTAFSGSSGILTILTGYFSNALFLLPLSVGAMVAAWRSWRQRAGTEQRVSDAEKILWLWMLALALVFMLPNQRSTRYLIPAMPALAILIALYWERIARLWFSLTLAACLVGLLAMGLIGYGAIRATQDAWIYSPFFWLFLAVGAAACFGGLLKAGWSRPAAALAGFAVLFALAWTTSPFNGELGRFRPETGALLKGQTVQVPSNFNGHFERYEFIIPGARIAPYFAAQPVDYADVDALFKTSRYALVQRRVGQRPCTQCRVLDERWDLRSRQDENDGMMAAFKTPETYWYAKEYLVERLEP